MKSSKGKGTKARPARSGISATKLADMIEEATVDDAHGEEEQVMGWFTKLEEQLDLPFDAVVLGASVRVIRVEHRDDNRLVAICTRGRDVQAIGLADLPLPKPMPPGGEWIEACPGPGPRARAGRARWR